MLNSVGGSQEKGGRWDCGGRVKRDRRRYFFREGDKSSGDDLGEKRKGGVERRGGGSGGKVKRWGEKEGEGREKKVKGLIANFASDVSLPLFPTPFLFRAPVLFFSVSARRQLKSFFSRFCVWLVCVGHRAFSVRPESIVLVVSCLQEIFLAPRKSASVKTRERRS